MLNSTQPVQTQNQASIANISSSEILNGIYNAHRTAFLSGLQHFENRSNGTVCSNKGYDFLNKIPEVKESIALLRDRNCTMQTFNEKVKVLYLLAVQHLPQNELNLASDFFRFLQMQDLQVDANIQISGLIHSYTSTMEQKLQVEQEARKNLEEKLRIEKEKKELEEKSEKLRKSKEIWKQKFKTLSRAVSRMPSARGSASQTGVTTPEDKENQRIHLNNSMVAPASRTLAAQQASKKEQSAEHDLAKLIQLPKEIVTSVQELLADKEKAQDSNLKSFIDRLILQLLLNPSKSVSDAVSSCLPGSNSSSAASFFSESHYRTFTQSQTYRNLLNRKNATTLSVDKEYGLLKVSYQLYLSNKLLRSESAEKSLETLGKMLSSLKQQRAPLQQLSAVSMMKA